MLIRFRVENFRSLYKEQELSLIAATPSENAAEVSMGKSSLSLLRAAGIYGANASGKSSVLQAFEFMCKAIRFSQTDWSSDGGVPRQPFLLNPVAKTEPSLFEAEFIVDAVRYRYGFVVDSKVVLEEWLFAYPQGRSQEWINRDHSAKQPFSFGRQLKGQNKSIEVLTRPNSLFLSAAAQNNHKMLTPIYQWFRQSLRFSNRDTEAQDNSTTRTALEDSKTKDKVKALLLRADFGITDYSITEEDIPEEIARFIAFRLNDEDDKEERFKEILANSKVSSIYLKHRGVGEDEVDIPFGATSNGTKAWFNLIGPIVIALANGGVLCIDEIESSLHPKLVLGIIKLFDSSKSNPNNAQLIFITHDVNVLESAELERDQIWFVEKDKMGQSHLYPLTDYHPRKQENIKRGYLQGRYGAIPYLRSFADSLSGEGEDNE